MKKLLLFLLPPLLACIVFFSAIFIISKTDHGKGALQVTASQDSINTKADVYLDGKLIGKSPFCKCDLPDMIPTGDHMIKLVPQDTSLQPFEQQIPINKSVITVVDVNFGNKNNTSGSIISLNPLLDTKATQIFTTSFPTGAKVFLDKNSSGQTPTLMNDVTDSDHDLLFDKDGYETKILHVHTVRGYKLSAIVFLAVKSDLNATTSATPAPITVSPVVSDSSTLSPTGNLISTPTSLSKVSLTPKVTPVTGPQVLILQTPTGFLHVRATANAYGTVVGQVTPGQSFSLVAEQNGWYEITLSDGTTGWVSGQYASKK